MRWLCSVGGELDDYVNIIDITLELMIENLPRPSDTLIMMLNATQNLLNASIISHD